MTESALEALEGVFSSVVAAMNQEFDSHDFILRLARTHQRLYIAALAAYGQSDQPFKTVHGQIARRLGRHTELVTKIGDGVSDDIFGQRRSAALWRRV